MLFFYNQKRLCAFFSVRDRQLKKSVKDVAKKFKERQTANKQRLKHEKNEELEPCTVAREEISAV